ncbi:hypothetical protein GKR75_07970 [Providencia sp. wls1919]|nr:hypothetical protein [Providencia sp. wls1919]
MDNIDIELLCSNNCYTLMMRGEHSKETVVNSAIAVNEIEDSEREAWMNCDEFHSKYYKVVPRDGYYIYYYESKEDVKGAFLATCLIRY